MNLSQSCGGRASVDGRGHNVVVAQELLDDREVAGRIVNLLRRGMTERMRHERRGEIRSLTEILENLIPTPQAQFE